MTLRPHRRGPGGLPALLQRAREAGQVALQQVFLHLHRLGLELVHGLQRNRRAFARQRFGTGLADAGGTAGDQRNARRMFSCHVPTLPIRPGVPAGTLSLWRMEHS